MSYLLKNKEIKVVKFVIQLCCIFIFFFCNSAYATQEFKVKDNDIIEIKISEYELTRITILGDIKIYKVYGASDIMDIQPDKEKGDLFILPKPNAPKSFSFYISDDQGRTYTLMVEQEDVPAELIILKTEPLRKKSIQESNHSSGYIVNIKMLMKAMATKSELSGYSLNDEADTKIVLKKNIFLHLYSTYTGSDFIGEIYTLENKSKQEMTFTEDGFLNFGENVKAVALEKDTLNTSEITFLYIVRLNKGNR